MREKIKSAYYWTKAAFFTLLIHAAILYVLIFGFFSESKEIEAGGKPIQATVVNQEVLDQQKEEKVRQIEDLEKKRQQEEAEKLKVEAEKKKQAQEKQAKIVEEQKRVEEEKKKQAQEKQEKLKQAEAEKKKLEADKKRKLEEEKKKKAEEAKRLKEEEEKKRKAEEKRKKEEERKKLEEKRKREETERKRQEEQRRKDAERKQAEEKLQRELEVRQKELEAQIEAEAVGALNAYEGRIKRAIENNWRPPSGVLSGLKVLLRLKVSPNGDVLSVRIVRSSGDPRFDQSTEIAVKKASPLPFPANPQYYQHIKEFEIEFSPDE